MYLLKIQTNSIHLYLKAVWLVYFKLSCMYVLLFIQCQKFCIFYNNMIYSIFLIYAFSRNLWACRNKKWWWCCKVFCDFSSIYISDTIISIEVSENDACCDDPYEYSFHNIVSSYNTLIIIISKMKKKFSPRIKCLNFKQLNNFVEMKERKKNEWMNKCEEKKILCV